MSDECLSEPQSNDPLPEKRHWLTGKRLVGGALSVLILLRIGVEFIPTRVQIGPETTVIDGPLRADGTIDYAAAINKEWAAGVTPDQNAAVDLLRAFGPGTIEESIREAYFERLGIDIPSLTGDVFVDYLKFLQAQGLRTLNDPEHFNELTEQQGTAMSRPWTRDEFPEVAAWLEANEVPLEAIIQAAAKPRYFSPLVPPNDDPLLNNLMPTEQNAREAARLLMAQAMLELGNGDIDRAFELTLGCHRLARLISEHPTLIGAMISVAVETMAAQGDAAIVLDGRLTAEQAAEFRRQLNALPTPRSMIDVYDRGERLMTLDATLALVEGRISGDVIPAGAIPGAALRMGFNPNPTLRTFNQFYDESLEILKLPDPAERKRELQALRDQYLKRQERNALWYARIALHARSAVSDWMGSVLVSMLIPAIEGAVVAADRRTIRLTLCDVGYALAEFRARTGGFPDTLEQLAPDDLKAVPLDLYTGDPLKYRRTDGGFLLYSVGENGIDDGGIMDGPTNRDDIAFGDVPEAVEAE